MEHSFDIDIATEYGIECAILLKNIYYWVEKNRANEKHFHNGNYWTYNSIKAFAELFPYISEKKVRTALKKLESSGLVITGNYNKLAYDRTTWYAITEKGKSILLKGQMDSPSGQMDLPMSKMDFTEKENGFLQNGEPIPDINTDLKTTNRTTDIKHKYGEYSHVLLTDADRDKLFDQYGEEMALKAITFLDEYIEMKGYKAKNHYLAIKKWVVDAVKEREAKTSKTEQKSDSDFVNSWLEAGKRVMK